MFQQIFRLANWIPDKLLLMHANYSEKLFKSFLFSGDAFSEMSQKSPELQEEFSYNSETQKALCKNGEVLLGEDSSVN